MSFPAIEGFGAAAGALGSSWTQQQAATLNTNGAGRGIASTAAELYAFWNADVFPNDQQSQLTYISGGGGGLYFELTVRASGTGGAINNYNVYSDTLSGGGHTEFSKWVGGAQTVLGSIATTVAANDIIKLVVVGTTFTAYKNGISVGTASDSALTSGSAGFGIAGSTTLLVDDWQGDIAGGSSGVVTVTAPLLASLWIGPRRMAGLFHVARPHFIAPTTQDASTPSANQSVTTDVGDVQLTGFAPTAVSTANQNVTTGVGALVATGFAPSVVAGNNQSVTTNVGALAATGFAPAPLSSNNQTATTGVGAVTATGFAPSAASSNNQAAVPGAGVLTATGFAPTATATANQSVTTGVGAGSFTGFAPSAVASGGQVASPGVGVVTATGFAPSPTSSNNQTVTTGVGVVTATGFAPSAASSNNQSATPGVGAPIVTGFAPTATASNNQSAATGLGVVTATGFAPSATAGNNQSATTGTGVVTATGFAPSIATGGNQTVTTDVGLVVATGYAPTAVASGVPDVILPPMTGGGTWSGGHHHHGTSGTHAGPGTSWRTRINRLLAEAVEREDETSRPAKKKKKQRRQLIVAVEAVVEEAARETAEVTGEPLTVVRSRITTDARYRAVAEDAEISRGALQRLATAIEGAIGAGMQARELTSVTAPAAAVMDEDEELILMHFINIGLMAA